MKQLPGLEVECPVRIPRKDQVETASRKAYVEPALFNTGIRTGTTLFRWIRQSHDRFGGGEITRFGGNGNCYRTCTSILVIRIQDLSLEIPYPVFFIDFAYRTIPDGILDPRADKPTIVRNNINFNNVCSRSVFDLQSGGGIFKPVADTARHSKTANRKECQGWQMPQKHLHHLPPSLPDFS